MIELESVKQKYAIIPADVLLVRVEVFQPEFVGLCEFLVCCLHLVATWCFQGIVQKNM